MHVVLTPWKSFDKITSQLAGQQLSENDLRMLMEELSNISVKWNDIGLQLGVSIGTLNAIKKDCNSTSDCLRETLTTWLKTCPSPTWNNMVDALRSKTVGEMNLAADLEQKYHLRQDTSIVATHHHALPAPPVSPSQAHTQTTLPSQSTMPPTQPRSFAFPYCVTPPSHPPSWSVPYYYSPHTSYPFPAPFPLTPLTSGAATTSVHPSYSQLHQVTPTSSRLHLPSVPAQATTPQFLTAPPQCPSPSFFNVTPQDTSPISSLATVTTPPDLPQRVTTHTLGMKVLYIWSHLNSVFCTVFHLKSMLLYVYIAMCSAINTLIPSWRTVVYHM